MEQEIKAIIEKNLPAQVGDVLKQRLEQAEKDAVKVKQQETLLGDKSVEITSLKATIESYKAFDVRNASLEAREKTVGEGERNLKIATLDFQLAAERALPQ